MKTTPEYSDPGEKAKGDSNDRRGSVFEADQGDGGPLGLMGGPVGPGGQPGGSSGRRDGPGGPRAAYVFQAVQGFMRGKRARRGRDCRKTGPKLNECSAGVAHGGPSTAKHDGARCCGAHPLIVYQASTAESAVACRLGAAGA